MTAQCVAPPDVHGYPTEQERQRCFSEIISFMNALPSRIGVAADTAKPADQLNYEHLVAVAVAAGQPVAAPGSVRPSGGSREPEPQPAEPEPSPELSAEPSPEPTPEDRPTPAFIGNPDTPVNDAATFPHFDVSVEGGTKVSSGGKDLVTIEARVCLTSLTDDATNGTTRTSWDPWSAQTSDGGTVEPVSVRGSSKAFPKESHAKPGQCVEGTMACSMTNGARKRRT